MKISPIVWTVGIPILIIGAALFYFSGTSHAPSPASEEVAHSTSSSSPEHSGSKDHTTIATWRVGDKIGAFTLTSLTTTSDFKNSITFGSKQGYFYDKTGNSVYGVTFTFTGTTTLTGQYQHNDPATGGLGFVEWDFRMHDAEDIAKLPQLPNSSWNAEYLCFKNTPQELAKMFPGNTGTTTIEVTDYSVGYYEKDTSCQRSVRLVKVLAS